jgi:hypothetical protein
MNVARKVVNAMGAFSARRLDKNANLASCQAPSALIATVSGAAGIEIDRRPIITATARNLDKKV